MLEKRGGRDEDRDAKFRKEGGSEKRRSKSEGGFAIFHPVSPIDIRSFYIENSWRGRRGPGAGNVPKKGYNRDSNETGGQRRCSLRKKKDTARKRKETSSGTIF